jgi:hypothetical protein
MDVWQQGVREGANQGGPADSLSGDSSDAKRKFIQPDRLLGCEEDRYSGSCGPKLRMVSCMWNGEFLCTDISTIINNIATSSVC